MHKYYSFKPTKADVKEWRTLCEDLNNCKMKASYNPINSYLVSSRDPLFVGMRNWLEENDYKLTFFNTGFGHRLHKDWEEKLTKLEQQLEEEKRGK